MNKTPQIVRLTNGPKHHFFGFHDLEISSRKTNQVLTLAVDEIDRPPMSQDRAMVCVLDPEDLSTPIEIATTSTFNYPQGARQQWLADTDHFIVNQRGERGTISSIYDASIGQKVGQIDQGTHVVDKGAAVSYSIDYGRLHRLGGYGYVGIPDEHPDDSAPAGNGIFATDIKANKSQLLLSIADAVNINTNAQSASSHHYFTHLVLNPTGDRLAFLHRYRLADGGEQTCLMTVGIDGNDCRLLAQGFLSHFDWKDDNSIMIWGRKSGAVSNIRNSTLLQNPLLRLALRTAKNAIRPLIGKTSMMHCSFLLVRDSVESDIEEFATGILRTDGHPMVNPRNRDWLVIDTYPDENGIRDLMLFRFSDRLRVDLERFRMLDDKPTDEVVSCVTKHMSEEITVPFPPELYAFTRSGLHCDLHPRWFSDGQTVAFDSIHEGSRQLYAVNAGMHLQATST